MTLDMLNYEMRYLVRKYFTKIYYIKFLNYSANQSGPQRPQYLTLLHVRLPPGFTPNSSVLRPKQVHSAVYENGMLSYRFLTPSLWSC